MIWNSRARFHAVMRYAAADRVPYFEEGLRKDVLAAWRKQGLAGGAQISTLFPSDRREEPDLDLRPLPEPGSWPKSLADLEWFKRLLDPLSPERRPQHWTEHVRTGSNRDYVLMLRVHRGLFVSMGVHDWERFIELMFLMKEAPAFVNDAMALQAEFAAALTELLLDEVQIDAAVFSEPISGNTGPLVSPRDYEEFALRSYRPLLQVLRQRGVETIILRTYANSRILIPSMLKAGFNCIWACEAHRGAMDYRELRKEFGGDLRLIGGIDLDALRRGKEEIQREIEGKGQLVSEGGYVPLADGRVRADVPFENYMYYRELLAQLKL